MSENEARALGIAREVIAKKKEKDGAPHAASLIRAGNWDDSPEVANAILGAEAALAHAASVLNAAEKTLENRAVMTSTAGDGRPYVTIMFDTLAEMRRFTAGMAELRAAIDAERQEAVG